LARDESPLDPLPVIDARVERVTSWIAGLGPLEPLLADSLVTEVMVNGDGSTWVEREGALTVTDVRLDPAQALHLIERVIAPLGLRIDPASPVVDARLADGSRVHAVVPPIAIDGPCLTIRRFSPIRLRVADFADGEVSRLLRWAIHSRANVLVCGGTGSGKTSLLNALAADLHPDERVVTIEDAAELRLPGRQVLRLESRPPNAEGVGAVYIRDLVRHALRMRPDRLIVGEIRGGEALDMLQAMNTGHDGSLSTCHANRAADALRRVETLVLMGEVDLPLIAVREQIAAAIDLVVRVERSAGGRRRVVEVIELQALGDDGRFVIRPLVEDGQPVAGPIRTVRHGAAHSFVPAPGPRPAWKAVDAHGVG
jgi:pilus assembly protein CpaF